MSNEQDNTNWKLWYWALILFLLVQIGLYAWITNWFVK